MAKDEVFDKNQIVEKRPIYKFKSGATYEGEWKGNERHGFGI